MRAAIRSKTMREIAAQVVRSLVDAAATAARLSSLLPNRSRGFKTRLSGLKSGVGTDGWLRV